MSEDPPDRLGCLDQLKAFFASTGAIFAGCFILFGPEEVRNDLPAEYVHPMAYGFIAFGVLFGITAIFASGRSRGAQAIATRFKGLLFAGIFAVVLWFCVAQMGPKLEAAQKLSDRGVPGDAYVEKHAMHRAPKGGATRYTTEISYRDGRATLKGRHGTERKTMTVIYLEDESGVVLPGGKGSFLELLDRDPGHGTAIGFAVAALVSVLVVLYGIYKLLVGPSRST